jgi:hypothetical protein
MHIPPTTLTRRSYLLKVSDNRKLMANKEMASHKLHRFHSPHHSKEPEERLSTRAPPFILKGPCMTLAGTCDNLGYISIVVSGPPSCLTFFFVHLKCHLTVFKTATISSAPLFVACPSRPLSHLYTPKLTNHRHDCQKTDQYLDLSRPGCRLL